MLMEEIFLSFRNNSKCLSSFTCAELSYVNNHEKKLPDEVYRRCVLDIAKNRKPNFRMKKYLNDIVSTVMTSG